MKERTPRSSFVVFVLIGAGAVLIGLTGIGNPSCDPVFPDKCLPGILLAGRALFVAVGAMFAAVGAVRLLEGRRPWATWVVVLAGGVEWTLGALLVLALVTGMFQPAIAFYQVWAVLVTIGTIGFGITLLASARSDRVMRKVLG